ncbi:MAG: class I SAM-dependent methyltransferase [Sphingomicrobium sp.]
MTVLSPGRSWLDALQEYEATLRSIVAEYPQADLLELGGGRWPAFRQSELPDSVRSYTVNDVSEEELSRLPEGYEKACFDVTGDASAFQGRYDFVFSRFLAEHVRSGRAMHRNVYEVLKPGGAAFHLIPTLYALPFVINRLLPERLGQMALSLSPSRDISPKFPAFYSYCRSDTPLMRRMFKDIGYRRVEIRNFYGHSYYERIPGLRSLERWFSAIASQENWSWCSSYAYLIAYK